MLIKQLTSLLLETTNPLVEESLTNKQRVGIYQNLSLPHTKVKMILQPSYSQPNFNTHYAEKDVLVPLVTIDGIKGKFNLGKMVAVEDFQVVTEFKSLFDFSEADWEAIESNLHGDNNFTDSLILGVYFHSLMRMNNYNSQDLIIKRTTNKKFKRLELDCTMHHFTFHDIKVDDYAINKHIIKDLRKDCSFKFKVIITQEHTKDGALKKAFDRFNDQNNPDDEVNNVTINVEVEEIER